MSPELKEALREWLADATSEEPSREVRAQGLCAYVKRTHGWEIFEELNNILDSLFPFGGFAEYYDRSENGTQHQCPARLAWVREQLGED